MKDLRAHFCCSLLALFVAALPTQMNAQETIYVSTGAGQQILAFDAKLGTVTGVCNINAVPEDVVVGPDGKLYVADTTGNRIFRVPTPIPAPAPTAASCGATTIYDQGTATCTGTCPTGPEGPSFLRIATLDLYFNTHGTSSRGVWKIPGIAGAAKAACSDVACPAPVQVFSSSSSGEGLDFDIFGKLLAVDQAGNQVVRDTVSCLNTPTAGCPAPFISNLSAPVGIAFNTCGDVLVASGKAVNRYDRITAALLDSLSFSGNNIPQFLEVDSTNRLFVVTASDESGKGGTFWRFDPPPASALRSFTTGLTVPIKTSLAPGIATSNALGLGVSASNASIQATFTPPTHNNPGNSNVYNFGAQHSFTATCNSVLQPFNLTVTAVKSSPTDAPVPDLTFDSPFPSPSSPTSVQQCPVALVNPQCLHYGGQHGFCTQYVEQATTLGGVAISDDPSVQPNITQFCSGSPSPFTFFVTFSSAEFINDPGGAHAVGANAPYTDCQSQDFYPQLSTGDPVRMSGTNSKHVVFNADDMFNGTISLNSPVSSCQTPTNCNPQFNIGQNINVKFTLLRNSSPFAAITNATEQVSIALVRQITKGVDSGPEFIPQTVVATKNSATLNFFVPNGSGQYSYNVDSSAFDKLPKGTAATYQFTIWGNGSTPFTFFTTGSF
jgi:hypothetical protein